MSKKRRDGSAFESEMQKINLTPAETLKEGDQDWEHPCDVCGQLPTVHPTGLCGPCCFGEAATVGGDW